MKLNEFFGNVTHDVNSQNTDNGEMGAEERSDLADKVFWFIVDSDDLHKKYFMRIASDIKNSNKNNDSIDYDWKIWKPMVNAGCVEYFHEHDVPGDPKITFNKKFRADMCKRLVDHYHKDIENDEYDLGD
jgi:hypothetical protein